MQELKTQARIAYSSTYQRCIENESLHKAVPGTSGDSLQFGFFNAPYRIGAYVEDNGLGLTVNQQTELPGKHLVDQILGGFYRFHLNVGDLFGD